MIKSVNLRIYPNNVQKCQILQMIGNYRFVWNQLLAMTNQRYKNNPNLHFLTKFKLDLLIKPLRQEYPFLKISDSSSFYVVTEKFVLSWKRFFNDQTGRIGKPRFHSRRSTKKSYSGKCNDLVRATGKRYLKLPKLGYVKSSSTNILKGTKVKRYTVELKPTGKYYVSLVVESKPKYKLEPTSKAIGIDVGVADLAILSNGIKYPSFDGSYFENKAIKWQKKYSRRKHLAQLLCIQDKYRKALCPRDLDSFSNWKKAQKNKALYQAKIANMRKDYLQKITTNLVKQYDVIVIEDLKAKNLIKNHSLAKSISNASWRMFRTMLEYKCKWYGKKLIAVDPKNTSRICSKCGYNSGAKPLDVRKWTCPKCGTHHDRDINAAINILNKAKLNGQGLALVNS